MQNGIRISSGVVKNCTTTGNGAPANPPVIGAHGIFVIGMAGPGFDGDVVKDCVSDFNYMDGINVFMAPPGKGTIIADCVTKGNLSDGIEVVNHCTVRGNNCLNNLTTGIHVSGPGTGNRIEDNHVEIETQVDTIDRTGVEMEAMTACSIAALTIYDMCKSIDRSMTIGDLALWEKTGGRSGVYRRTPDFDGLDLDL